VKVGVASVSRGADAVMVIEPARMPVAALAAMPAD